MSLVSALNAIGDVEVIMSSPNQWDPAAVQSARPNAAFVGLSSDSKATDSLLQLINTDTPELPLVVFGVDGDWERRCGTEAPIMDMLQSPINANKTLVEKIKRYAIGNSDAAKGMDLNMHKMNKRRTCLS